MACTFSYRIELKQKLHNRQNISGLSDLSLATVNTGTFDPSYTNLIAFPVSMSREWSLCIQEQNKATVEQKAPSDLLHCDLFWKKSKDLSSDSKHGFTDGVHLM